MCLKASKFLTTGVPGDPAVLRVAARQAVLPARVLRRLASRGGRRGQQHRRGLRPRAGRGLAADPPPVFFADLAAEQAVEEEDEGPLQAVDDGEQVGHGARRGPDLENAQHPGAAQDEELGKGLEGQQPAVFERGDLGVDAAELLPQDPQCPAQEDGVDLRNQEEGTRG